MADRAPATTQDLDALADAFLTASRALVGIAVRTVGEAPGDVTLVQHRLLVLLATGGTRTVGVLADELGTDQSNASRLCDRLQRAGYVARRRSERDGRAVEVVITREGRGLVEVVRSARRDAIRAVLQHLPPEQAVRAVDVLTAFSDAAHESGERAWDASAAGY